MMVRSQITLDRELQRRVRERASQLGISLAEYVRRLVVRDLGESRRRADPSLVIALGRSAGSNIARDKDRLIGEAVAAEHERELRSAPVGRQTLRPRSESQGQ
jgi:hypothetical protein